MTDEELIAAVKPPVPLGVVFLTGSESDLELLLDLLFAAHLLVCDNEIERPNWFYTDIGWPIWRLYENNTVPPLLRSLAPEVADAVALARQWQSEWTHSCGEYEWWAWRRDEWGDLSIKGFFRDMLKGRVGKGLGDV
jgi:hypothetical protein